MPPKTNPNVHDHRSIKLEDVMKPNYIPFLGGRPKRDEIISADDEIDLRILFNTTSTVEEFLNAHI
jgi:hypothetical protein